MSICHSATLLSLLAALSAVSALRFASYNIQSGSGMDGETVFINKRSHSGYSGKYDLHRTAQAIAALNADVIGLQEVDNNTRRHPNDDQTGLRVCAVLFPKIVTTCRFAVLLSQMVGLPYRHFGKMRNFQGGGYGEHNFGPSLVAALSVVPL